MTQVYVIGDSHVEALAAGSALLRQEGAPSANPSVKFGCLGSGDLLHQPFFEKNADTIRFTIDQMTEALVKLTDQAEIAARPDTIFGFSMGLDSAAIYRAPVWRQFAPWRVAAEARLPALSDAGCELAFSKNSRFILAFLDAVHDIGLEFFVIPAPPPRHDDPVLDRGIKPAVLLEIDRLYRLWAARELDRRGYPHLPLPDTVAADGFLKPDYKARRPDDRGKASPLYGALVANQLRDFMAKRAADVALPAPVQIAVAVLRGVRVNNDPSELLA